jgi:peptide/nickel transport system substrate-binding protein
VENPKELAKKVVRISFYTAFVAAFLFVMSVLFLRNDFSDKVPKDDSDLHGYQTQFSDELRIIVPNEPSSLEPTKVDVVTRQRLIDTYEPLVTVDANLKMIPSLALSWGMIDDLTWEFKLRPEVKFHDGSMFGPEDVESSIDRAMTNVDSELKDILSGIGSVEIVDDATIRVKTLMPDPLMLQKISMVWILPSEYEEKNMDVPVGTGSYKFVSWIRGGDMILEKFDDYWGDKAKSNKISISFISDKSARVQALIDDEADILLNVPFEAANILKTSGFVVETVPSLEVQFVIFNMRSVLMQELNNRKAVSLVINQNDLIKKVGGFAKTANQFVSSGIFGYSTDLADHEYSLDKAKILVSDSILQNPVQIHLLAGLEVLGEYLRNQLEQIGVHAVVSYLDFKGLMDSIQGSKADIYFLAMKSDLGDASSFFNDIAYSKAGFNIGGYINTKLDVFIEASATEMNIKKRQKLLKDSMKIVVDDDPIGVPLFEYENLYAHKDNIVTVPRIDGFVHFDDLTVKSQ